MREGGVYAARVVDRFGDMGIVGVAIVRGGELETFLMSCRALGRRIEAQILRHVCQQEGRSGPEGPVSPEREEPDGRELPRRQRLRTLERWPRGQDVPTDTRTG